MEALWYEFRARHKTGVCRFGEDHETGLLVKAPSLTEARREVQFIWGKDWEIDPTPIGSPVASLRV